MFAALLGGLNLKTLSIAFAIAAISGAYWLGYDHAKTSAENAQAQGLLKQYEQQTKEYWQVRKVVSDLEQKLQKADEKSDQLKKRLKRYVSEKTDVECGPSVGIVSVLNAARKDLSDSAALADDQSRAASGISYIDQTEDTLNIIKRYNALMVRHNALVDWLEETRGQIRTH